MMREFFTVLSWEFIIKELWLTADLLLAAVLGFCIGIERKLRSKEAGIRTHTIVCVGAALMMLISKYAFDSEADSARVAAQIVAGVGFLGAGIIVYRKNEVHGLTTAAGVWTTAGVGMACGGGLYIVAVITTGLLIFIQWLLHRNFKVLKNKKFYMISIAFFQKTDEREKIKQLFGTDRYYRLVMERQNGVRIYKAKLHTDVEYSSERLDEIMAENDFIISLERYDDI